MSPLDVSVVVCTRNRAASLARCLDAFRQAAPAWTMKWELIVVDNGSQDGTPALLARTAEEAWAPFRIVTEPRAGVSRAKNRGVAEARGDVLAFTDDDCLVTPAWLPELLAAFQTDPEIGLVAGRSELADPAAFPHCVRTSQTVMTYRWPTAPDFAAGNNLAIRASALARVGPFDVRLGPGTRVHGAEDNEMIYRLLRAGYPARYVPAALLYHDHRQNDAELWPTRRKYAIGNGAFLAKYVLRGDRYAAKLAYWQVGNLLFGPEPPARQIPDRRTVARAMAIGALRRLLHLE